MEVLKICLLCTIAAIAYGIVHDQVTVRICVEYFSVFHPTILPLSSPTLLALQWGIVATWWIGAAFGVLLSIAARGGSRKPLNALDLRRKIMSLLVCMSIASLVAGAIGFVLTKHGFFDLDWIKTVLPPEKHAGFMADLWAHSASYLVGIVGGVIVCTQTYISRSKPNPVG